MLSMVKMLLKGEVGGHEFNIHGNYICDRGKAWKNHGIESLNFCGNPVICQLILESSSKVHLYFHCTIEKKFALILCKCQILVIR